MNRLDQSQTFKVYTKLMAVGQDAAAAMTDKELADVISPSLPFDVTECNIKASTKAMGWTTASRKSSTPADKLALLQGQIDTLEERISRLERGNSAGGFELA